MLIGPSHRPQLPIPPDESLGLQGVFDYLRSIDRAVNVYISSIVGNSVGVIGTRGISGTGVPANNFNRILFPLGGTNSAVWTFMNFEPDATYGIWYTMSTTTGVNMLSIARSASNVVFTLAGNAPSGLMMDVLMLR